MTLVHCGDCNSELSDLAAACPTCSRPNTSSRLVESWRFSYAWSWYQDHVKHRTTMLNYLLVSTGILANAYVALLRESKYQLAVYLASFSGILAYSFMCMDVIALRKIQVAKRVLHPLNQPIDRTQPLTDDGLEFAEILDTARRHRGKVFASFPIIKDRFWSLVVELAIITLAMLAACNAAALDNSKRLLWSVVVAAAVLPVGYASWRRRQK